MKLQSRASVLREFDYGLKYARLNLRQRPDLYRIGRGEQGVLLVEPYKSELLSLWRFKTPSEADASAKAIYARYRSYKANDDFVGMDMARKFLQMGFTRARRYANRSSGRKYAAGSRKKLPLKPDASKAAAGQIFRVTWERVRTDQVYLNARKLHRVRYER